MLRLNVGTNRKIGQPDYGSAGASCNLELELDTGLFQDLEGLQQVVKRAYAACNQAVNDELARIAHHTTSQSHAQPQEVIEVRTSPAIQGASVNRLPAAQFANQPSPRPATASQVRALRAICARRKIDLMGLLRERFALTPARARTATGPSRRLGVLDDRWRGPAAVAHAREARQHESRQ
jgi:hypothetical protein